MESRQAKTLAEKMADSLEKNQVEQEAVLLVGFSGGRDSVCLLHALTTLGRRLAAVHVNHRIRPEARQDADFCRKICVQWHIPFQQKEVDVPSFAAQEKQSVEEAARTLRRQALEECQQKLLEQMKEEERVPVYIVLAHHQQDQAETVLMHLLRGSGLDGLCGMKEKSGCYLRPMLGVSPKELDDYMAFNHLPHVEDATNEDLSYERNRIRHQLLPVLKTYNPEIVPALCRTALLLAEDGAALEEQAESARKTYLKEKGLESIPAGTLPVAVLEGQSLGVKRRIVRDFLEEEGHLTDMSAARIDDILSLAQGRTGRRLCLPHSLTLIQRYGIIQSTNFHPGEENESQDKCPYDVVEMSLAEALTTYPQLDGGYHDDFLQMVSLDSLSQEERRTLCLRHRRQGDRMAVRLTGHSAGSSKANGQGVSFGHRKVQDVLTDAKVAADERDRLWVLASGSRVLWIEKVRLSDDVRVGCHTERVLVVRRKENAE